MMKLALRMCALVLLLLATAVPAADLTKDGIINKDGSLTVYGSVISPPLASTGTVTIKTLAGVVLSLSEPTPIADAELVETRTAAIAERAIKERDAAQTKFDATKAPADDALLKDAKAAADKANSEHQAAVDELKKLRAAAEDKNTDRRFVPLSLRKGDLVEVSYITEPDPHQDGPVRDRLVQPVRKAGATVTGTITDIASDLTWVVLRTKYPPAEADKEQNVSIQTPVELQPTVKGMRPGDGINATYISKANNIRTAQTLEWQSKPVDLWKRWVALFGGALFLFILAAALSGGNPASLIVGADNRYSTSKFQTALWFWLVLSAYIAIVAHRLLTTNWTYVGGVDIPVNLAALSGISVFSFTAAKFITVGQIDRAADKGQPTKPVSTEKPRLSNLIRNDEDHMDLGNYQMVVITILAVAVYAFSVVEFMESIELRRKVTMPDVDATLLAIFGLGQLAYLGKKVAGEGLTPAEIELSSKAINNAVTNAKLEADKADKAAEAAATKAKEAQTALDAVKKATTKAAAEPDAVRAENAAKDAAASSAQATAALSAAAACAADAERLVVEWKTNPDIDNLTKTSGTARSDADRAKSAAGRAEQAANAAKDLAAAARKEADGKSA